MPAGVGGLCPAISGAGLCGGAEDRGHAISGVEFSGGDAPHQVAGLVVGKGEAAAVEAVEGDDGG